jgi:hypothetical protein
MINLPSEKYTDGCCGERTLFTRALQGSAGYTELVFIKIIKVYLVLAGVNLSCYLCKKQTIF